MTKKAKSLERVGQSPRGRSSGSAMAIAESRNISAASVSAKRRATVSVSGKTVVFTEAEQEQFHRLCEAFSRVSGVCPSSPIVDRLVSQLTSLLTWDSADDEASVAAVQNKMRVITEYLREIGPQTGVQTMLAVQMIGVHEAATKSLFYAKTTRDMALQESSMLRATRFMRLFNEQLEALAKLKGTTGQQKVTVEHVHVHKGGQAVVGMVAPAVTGGSGDE